jgi:hypothetical protein
MRKNILIIVALLIGITFVACDEATNPIEEKGTINISSTPAGAQIWVDGDSTGVVTPGVVEASAGFHDVTLKLAGYADLTISHISVEGGVETLISENTTLSQYGSLNVISDPAGAEIWLDGVNSGKVTPYVFGNLDSSSVKVELKLANYINTSQTVDITMGNETVVNIALVAFYSNYTTPVKIYETFGTNASQPSGVDLSSGGAFGTSDTDNNGKIDLYYFSNSDGGYLVQSAHKSSKMTRETFFKVGSASDLNDGVASTAKDDTWTDNMTDREANYVFLYDADGHYSKLKIVNFHAGSGASDPSWVEVAWIYNNIQDDLVF